MTLERLATFQLFKDFTLAGNVLFFYSSINSKRPRVTIPTAAQSLAPIPRIPLLFSSRGNFSYRPWSCTKYTGPSKLSTQT